MQLEVGTRKAGVPDGMCVTGTRYGEPMTTEAPREPKIKLTNLTPGYLGDIGPEEFLEGMEFTDLDLAEVDSTQATYLDCSLSRMNFGGSRGSQRISPVHVSPARRIEDSRADTWTMPRGSFIHTEISGTRIGAGVVP